MFRPFICLTFMMALSNLVIAQELDPQKNSNYERQLNIGAFINLKVYSEEVGEVARIIARRYGEQSEKESDKAKELGEELADVIFVVLCLANQTGIDLQKAFDQKMKLKSKRDHDRHQNNHKLK